MLIRLAARLLVSVGVFAALAAGELAAADLQERTRQAFERYAQTTEARI
jgi:hypothetical protein